MELEVLKWTITLLLGVGGWLMRNMITSLQDEIKLQKQDIDKLKTDKLSKDDFKDFKSELREMFNEIKTDIRDLKNEKNNLAR